MEHRVGSPYGRLGTQVFSRLIRKVFVDQNRVHLATVAKLGKTGLCDRQSIGKLCVWEGGWGLERSTKGCNSNSNKTLPKPTTPLLFAMVALQPATQSGRQAPAAQPWHPAAVYMHGVGGWVGGRVGVRKAARYPKRSTVAAGNTMLGHVRGSVWWQAIKHANNNNNKPCSSA